MTTVDGEMADVILLVEDEEAIRDAIAYTLRQEGFAVVEAADGTEAIEYARREPPALVLLDLMLPALPGLDVCRTLRSESDVPIIIVTAKDAELDRVVGLEIGADDYITKPFSMAELLSRVRALLRRRELDRRNRPPRHTPSAPSRWTASATKCSCTTSPCTSPRPSSSSSRCSASIPSRSSPAARSWSTSGRASTSATNAPATCMFPAFAARSNAPEPAPAAHYRARHRLQADPRRLTGAAPLV